MEKAPNASRTVTDPRSSHQRPAGGSVLSAARQPALHSLLALDAAAVADVGDGSSFVCHPNFHDPLDHRDNDRLLESAGHQTHM